MSQDRIEELWSRFLAGGELDGAEKAELLDALEKDPSLRAELLGDDSMDGLLRVRRWAKEPDGTFADAFWHRVAAEADGKGFLEKLQPRIDANISETPPAPRKTRRRVRRETLFPYWPLLGLAGAAAVIILIVVTYFAPPKPVVAPPVPDAPMVKVPPPAVQDHGHHAPAVETPQPDAAERARLDREHREQVERELMETIEKARAKLPPAPPPAPVAPEVPRPETPVKPTETRVALARLESASGEVYIIGSVKRLAKAGDDLAAGEGLQTVGMRAQAVVVYPDRTRVELRRDAVLETLAEGGIEGVGKRIQLKKGLVVVDAMPQPRGRAMAIVSAQAEARVLGTKFRFEAEEPQDGFAQLEVKEGRVKLTRLSDKATVDVTSGTYAVAAPGLELVARRGEAPPLLRDGLVAHWSFDEAGGNVVRDHSGKAKDGIPTGGQWTPGRFGHAMVFAGQQKGSGVLCQPVLKGSGPLTIGAWVKTGGKGDHQSIVAQSGATPADGEFGLGMDPQGRAGWGSKSGLGGFALMTLTSITDGKWHSLVGVREQDGTGRFYLDGKLVSLSAPAPPAALNPTTLVMGGVVCCHLQGGLDDVRVYDRALSADEVAVISGVAR